ncbi:MAG: type II/IV secretion system protein [Magnetococcales bacterium]|nr:type II/IV secretion system protein [Magnetococcales bacterium]
MQILQDNQAPVTGIWSLQLLSRNLLHIISKKIVHALVVTIHINALRQTYYEEGRTVISRKTPIRDLKPDALSSHIHEEVLRTKSYLVSLRLLRPGESLDIVVVTNEPRSTILAKNLNFKEGINCTVVDIASLEQKIGLSHKEPGLETELLFGQLLLRRPPKNHYGLPDELQYYINNPVKRFIKSFQKAKASTKVKADDAKPTTVSVRRLGDVLIEKKLLTQDQLQAALTEQRGGDRTLGRVLIDMGMVAEKEVRDTLAELLKHESVDLTEVLSHPEALSLVTKSFAQQHSILPLLFDEETQVLTVAMSNPMNVAALDYLLSQQKAGVQIKPLLAGELDITGAIDRLYSSALSVEGVLRELETGEVELDDLGNMSEETFSHPMVRLVNALLQDAVKRGASDIHIGPTAGFLRVRYRIDGILHQIYSVHKKLLASLVVRIKVMGNINIAETRLPQTGQISLPYLGKTVNFRVSIQPTINGENIVLRVLDLSQEIRSLDELGVSANNLNAMYTLLKRPGGLVLVTGPTGSGKTTSLYSMLSHLNKEGVNIMTMEDPVEYPMSTILQTSINHEAGLDYAVGIKALLWQDPDIILVGEIHDKETANMSLQAAMTGHMVFTTLHANSTLGALPRLVNLGVTSDIISGNINSILSQRLVRKLCKKCSVLEPIQSPEAMMLGVDMGAGVKIARPVGCEHCYDTGYKGRLPLMEVLLVDEDFDELVFKGSSHTALKELAVSKGFHSMVDDGFARVLAGETTLEEVSRVLDISSHTQTED